MSNLYEILEVSNKASKEVIDKAYHVLAKKYHPDLQANDEQRRIAEEKMKKINEAYDILSNEQKILYLMSIRAFKHYPIGVPIK